MKLKLFLIGFGMLLMLGIGFLYLELIEKPKCQKEKRAEYSKGYAQHQIEAYAPVPIKKLKYSKSKKSKTPIKKRNPKLKEKFRG
jgi:hypothetical protein